MQLAAMESGQCARCRICRSADCGVIQEGVWDSPDRNVVACRNCGVVFLDPMMEGAESDRFYASYEEYERQREPSAAEFERKQEKEQRSAARQLALIRQYLKAGDILCDIGASYGHFLRLAAPEVAGLVAVEPNPKSRSALTGAGVRAFASIHEMRKENVRLDAVAMFHTFEHVADPLAFLLLLRETLRPGGKVFLEVPNAGDALLTLYGVEAFRRFYYQSMHCYYYDAGSLEFVLRRAGFEPLRIEHVQRYSLGNHLEWLAHGRAGGNSEFDRLFGELDLPYRRLLCREHKSDTLFGVFQTADGGSE